MSGTIITNAGAGNQPTTNELKVDMHKKRMTSYAKITPLTVILARLASTKAGNFRVDVIEEHAMPTKVEIAQSESSVGTTIYVSAYGTSLVQDTLLYNPRADDIRLVDSQPTSNTVTVTISQGGTTSSAVWEQGDIVHVLPPALAENDALSTMRCASITNTNVYNLMQIIKLQYAITRVEDKMVSHFGGPGEFRQQLKRQKYREFREKGELLRYFGGRQTGGTAPATKRMSNGMVRILKEGTHYKDFGGIFTETGFDNWLGDYQDDNPDAENITFAAAPNVLRQIGYFAKDKIRISPMTKEYGLNIKRYINGPLDVDLVPLPLLTDATTRGWGFLIDWSRMMLKDIDRPTFYPDALSVGQSENIYDTYREVSSMLIANESKHAMCVGATL